jgi:cobalt-zinc-cadmium efflux system outer membrane protein
MSGSHHDLARTAALCVQLLVALPLAAQERAAQHHHGEQEAGAAIDRELRIDDLPELAGGPVTLDDLLRRAGEHNPELIQAQAEIRAAEGLRQQVGLYPNPMLGYTTEENPMSSGRDGGKRGGFIEQTFVTGGKLRKNRAIFDREVERAQAVGDLIRTRELNRVRILYYRTVAAQRRVELEERLAALARETADVTGQLYNTGLADLPDRLAIENEAEMVDLARQQARRELARLWRELRATVGDAALTPARLADTLDAEVPRLDADSTLAAILEGSPELAFAELGVERAQLAVERERAGRVPDVVVNAALLDNREPLAPGGPSIGTEWKADVGVRIPLFDRNQGNVAAAAAELERSDAEGDRARLKIEARFAPVFAVYEQEYDRASRYRERILPRARQAYELYLARHQQMAAAYPQVLLAQRTYFEAESSYVDALERLWESVVLLSGMLLSEEPSPQILDDAVVRRTPIEVAR